MRGAEDVAFQSLVPETVPLPRSHAVLSCESKPEALSYEFFVGTLDQPDLSRSQKLKKCEYQVPESALAGLPRPTRLNWQVDAILPEDRHASSDTFHALVD
jgi:hypothetical protein